MREFFVGVGVTTFVGFFIVSGTMKEPPLLVDFGFFGSICYNVGMFIAASTERK